jgi:microsomal dipeptidase-like Zn-dependent dipeptidase
MLPGQIPIQGQRLAQPGQLQPIAQTGPQLSPCVGLVGQTIDVHLAAQATSPFSVRLTWSGPAGEYRILGGATATVTLGAGAVAAPAAKIGGHYAPTMMQGSSFDGIFDHVPALPDFNYSYSVQATLADGRKACGSASAKTSPPPALANISGRYIDMNQVALAFTLQPFVHEAHVYRGSLINPANKAGDVAVAQGNVAGAQGQLIPSVVVDPGPAPVPYDASGTYIRAPVTYPFTILVTWTAYPDGSGPSKSFVYPATVGGPATIIGYADLHNHQMSYLGFGGNPQKYPLGRYMFGKAFGPIDSALPWCTPVCGPGGVNDLADWALRLTMYGTVPTSTVHAVGGFPAFDGYPRWNSFTGQAYYENWLKRAHLGGLQLIVVHPVNNAWMCTTLNHTSTAEILAGLLLSPPILAARIAAYQTTRDPDCLDDGQAVNQINEVWAMQRDIDNRVGDERGHLGPNTGWYRVVRTPQEARAVIAAGKLAVVIGMEVDNPFDCADTNTACNNGGWNNRFDFYYQQGVRHFFPIHFYNNAFGGSANSNALITHSFTNHFSTIDCGADGYEYDNHRCNSLGLTPEGKSLMRAMMRRGMIIDIDHMSARAVQDAFDLVTPTKYPVVSSHTGFVGINHGDERNEGQRTDAQIASMLKVGGMVAVIPHQGKRGEVDSFPYPTSIGILCGNSSETVASAYRYAIQKSGNGPVGIGTDLNGFAGWPSPRFGPDECMGDHVADYDTGPHPALRYPYTISATGFRVDSRALDPGPSITTTGQRWPSSDAFGHAVVGQKVFDFNTDGFAHIGLLPDMIADWEGMGMKPAELDPLFSSAEGYIRIWERAAYLSAHVAY